MKIDTRSRRLVWRSLLPAILVTLGCVGTDVGNPQDTPDSGDDRIALGLAADITTASQSLVQGGLEIEAAWTVVESISLRRDCDGASANFVSEGPFVVNLLEPQSYPIPLTRSAESPDYCRLSVLFAPAKSTDTGPEALRGNWLLLSGNVSGTPFTITASRAERLRFVGRSAPIRLEANEINALFADLGLLEWLAENVSDIEEELTLDDDTVGPLGPSLRFAIRSQARLYRDDNQNSRVDPDEVAPIAIPEF